MIITTIMNRRLIVSMAMLLLVFASSANAQEQPTSETPEKPPASQETATNPAAPEKPEQPAPAKENDKDSVEDLLDLFDAEMPEKPAPPKNVPLAPDMDGQQAETLQFTFRYANWEDVLKQMADLSGLTLDMQTTPPGTFSYFDKDPKTPVESLDILNGYLIQRGYILVRRDKFLIVSNIENGIPANLVPTIDKEELADYGNNELIRVVFDLDQSRAEDLVEDVQSQLGPQGEVVAMGATNRLVVTGLAQNLRRIDKLLIGSKLAAGPDGLNFQAFPLEYILAADAEPTVRALLGVESSFDQGSSSSRSRSSGDPRSEFMRMMAERMSGGRGGPPGGSRGESSSSSSSSTSKARITIDERTNSLLIAATQAELLIVEQALEQIDIPAKSTNFSAEQSGGPVLKVYEIEDGELDEIAETIMAMVPGVMINEDDRADVLHVVGIESKQREVERLIETIIGKGVSTDVNLVPMMGLDPEFIAYTLGNIFINDEQPPIIQPDMYGQNLIVKGTSNQLLQVKTLILQMSQEEANRPKVYGINTGPIRRMSLGGESPEEMIKLLQQMWQATGKKPLNVISSESLQEKLQDKINQKQESESTQPADDKEKVDSVEIQADEITTIPVLFQSEEPSDDSEASESSASGPTVTIIDDQLVISGDDQEELDLLQSMLSTLIQRNANKTQWSIYYLRMADATASADMLRKLFPDIDVESTETGTSQFGSQTSSTTSITTTTSSTVRIIPDPSSNALFISGPAEKIAEIEGILKILDNTDLPESLRDRVARTIPVLYANVEDVAEILNDVYVDRLPQQNQNRRAPGGEEQGGGVVAGDLTIGVDAQTSQIIVSCNDALFQEIEGLVFSLDESAMLARRTVRIINLENTNAADVQMTLGTLIPKVTFTTSSSGRTSSSRNNSSQGNQNQGTNDSGRPSSPFGGGGGGGSDDSRRRFFEEMMRRRSQGGGGPGSGGPPFGGFGGFRDSGRGR